MLLFYVRHGDPTYDPDQLTPLGRRQAEAVAKRLAMHGIDRIYASTSTRAIQTAQPTAEMLKKDIVQLDFCNESHAWEELSGVYEQGFRTWAFYEPWIARLFVSDEIRALGDRWYEHPRIAQYHFEKGINRIRQETHAWLASLGYEFEPGTNLYRAVRPNEERIALFAHQGFGLAFLSCVLNIPYPEFSTHFDMSHTGMTVIEFQDRDGYACPKTLMLASDSHLYREGLPTRYHNALYF